MKFSQLTKLNKGDKVALLSPSFGAPAYWPHVYELGLERMRDVFRLDAVEFPSTKVANASTEQRAADLIAAFKSPEIKAVIATIGGDDQVTYVKSLPAQPFVDHPKPFFGSSDNSHFINHLWLNGIPSYYGGSLFTEFAMHFEMDPFTVRYLNHALFQDGLVELEASPVFNDMGLDWSDPQCLKQRRRYQDNEGWYWDGTSDGEGISWGGCLESIDEMLRHNIALPSLDDFASVVLFLETSEELPSAAYVARVIRALGERGILERVRGLLVGRPKAWEFDKPNSDEAKTDYKERQRTAILEMVRRYNICIPIVQNLDFGHTAPQICLPVGRLIQIKPSRRTVAVEF